LVVAALAALVVQTLVDYAGAYRDTSLAIVLTGSFAVGSVLVTATDGGIAVGINAYLFGSLATVSRANAAILGLLSVVVTLGVTLAYRPLVYVTFDEVGARAAGLDVTRYNQLLAVLTAVVVVGAMQIMGVILVAAMLVIPVAAATGVRGFKRSIGAAVCAGLIATVAGVTLSYVYDVAAGGTIVPWPSPYTRARNWLPVRPSEVPRKSAIVRSDRPVSRLSVRSISDTITRTLRARKMVPRAESGYSSPTVTRSPDSADSNIAASVSAWATLSSRSSRGVSPRATQSAKCSTSRR